MFIRLEDERIQGKEGHLISDVKYPSGICVYVCPYDSMYVCVCLFSDPWEVWSGHKEVRQGQFLFSFFWPGTCKRANRKPLLHQCWYQIWFKPQVFLGFVSFKGLLVLIVVILEEYIFIAFNNGLDRSPTNLNTRTWISPQRHSNGVNR